MTQFFQSVHSVLKKACFLFFAVVLCAVCAFSAFASSTDSAVIIEEYAVMLTDDGDLDDARMLAPPADVTEEKDPDAARPLLIEEEMTVTAETTDEKASPLSAQNIALLIAGGVICAVFLYIIGRSKRHFDFKRAVPVVLCAGLLVRLILAAMSPGHSTDMGCFSGWANALAQNGPGSFYTSGMFADYPPGYLYVLLFLGKLAGSFGFSLSTGFGSVFLRLPAMLCDLGIGLLLYREFRKSAGEKRAFSLLALAVLNPVSILNSAAWGQVDSVLALLLVAVFIMLRRKKLTAAALFYGLAVLVKPQALIVGPVFAIAYILPFFDKKTGVRSAAKNLALGVVAALGVIFVGSLPFKGTQGLFYLVDRYVETATSYPYASINAFNLYSLLGANWASQTDHFLFMTWAQWGTFGIVAAAGVTLALAVISIKRNRLDLPLCAVVFLSLVFALGHNMHERYIYSVLMLLLCACGTLGDKRFKTSYAMLSGAAFINIACVLLCGFYGVYNLIGEGYDIIVRILSALMLYTIGSFVFTAFDVCSTAVPPKDIPEKELRTALDAAVVPEGGAGDLADVVSPEGDSSADVMPTTDDSSANTVSPESGSSAYVISPDDDSSADSSTYCDAYEDDESEEEYIRRMEQRKADKRQRAISRLLPASPHPSWSLKEKLMLLALTCVYAAVSFFNLGSTDVPQSYWKGEDGDRVVVTLPSGSSPVSVWTYGGISTGRAAIYASDSGAGRLAATADVDYDVMFRWNVTELSEQSEKYTIKAYSDVWLNELVFVDADGSAIVPVSMAVYKDDERVDSSAAKALFDEQAKKPDVPSAQNGMYFDELYHGRTALEHLLGLTPYENSHPPLGKVFIMLGIAVFGMTPFGWRFSGALFGVLMLPALYLLVRRITKSSKWSMFATALFALDFMHFSQTRIATIDVFVVLFIILMYYFMYRYTELNFHRDGLKKTLLPLGLSGLCFGLGAACKWTGIYAGIGLAVIFFLSLFKRYEEYRAARETGDLEAIEKTASFKKNTVLTLAFCVGFFIVVPVAVYLLSYLPYFLCAESPYDLKGVWGVQEFMFNYHSQLTATHPYESRWFTWPFDVRPIWYYSGSNLLPEGTISSISAFGNPAVWLSGIAGVVMLASVPVKKSARLREKAVFILIGFAAQFAPWILISRATFIYHYFPSVPFIILALTVALQSTVSGKLTESGDLVQIEPRFTRFIRIALPVAALVLFIAFYPVLSGLPVSKAYASLLVWLPSWTFFI